MSFLYKIYIIINYIIIINLKTEECIYFEKSIFL